MVTQKNSQDKINNEYDKFHHMEPCEMPVEAYLPISSSINKIIIDIQSKFLRVYAI